MSTFNSAISALEQVGAVRDAALENLLALANIDNGDSVTLTTFQTKALEYNQAQAKAEVINEAARGAVKIVKDTAQWINR